jgi:hypothetical protein
MLLYNAQLRLSEMSRVECRELSDVSANITVAIFMVNIHPEFIHRTPQADT